MFRWFPARCSLAALVPLAVPAITGAQTPPTPVPSPTTPSEIGRVRTSDRRSEPIGETSRPTCIVDRAQIESEGAGTLGDALVGLPSVQLFAYGPFGAETDFSIRSAASQRTLLLVDGQPNADPTTGSVDLTQLSTAGIQRIEIVDSAASTLYGTSASESFTVPALQDLYYPGYSNPNLLPEKSRDSDATIVVDGALGSLSLGWFSRSGSNFIVLDSVTFIPYNTQRAQTAGFTISARSKPIRGLIADANVTDLYRARGLTTNARLPRSPVGQASAGLTRPFGTTCTSFGLRFGVVGSVGDDAANVPPPLVGRYDSYTSIDAYLRYNLSRDGILSIRYPNVGRRIVVELSTP